ncbi:MAG: hypothetical protein DSO09_02535 [Candidatus Methanomethylicota archaeon]|jgi:riboflavin kinase|uniref:Riboflavin kinase n=1 Tax=Thermoproteota archaeon TaxID=2056631 RepID=A0A520KFU0_9CREN|nr:MAG: DUF120 domain-containing protein [Candidatus Verstraetearchaeota archaeon]TDA39271.1 MAG: hypothetical protein DSO09_02535 [Candidatus Verstraetearchaeota archaeon]
MIKMNNESIESELWFTLYYLFKIGGYKGSIFIGTEDLGKILGISQQTASRRILDLLKRGYIEREIRKNGQLITITEKGFDVLKEIYRGLKEGFEEKEKFYFIKGHVFTGFGEGAYYITRPGYYKQFEEKLGFKPFPGTLNLKLKSLEDIKIRKELEILPGILIKGFVNSERSYGDVKCFKVKIYDDVDGALLLIDRTHYNRDVIEVISEENIRKKYNLKDGDLVYLKVMI